MEHTRHRGPQLHRARNPETESNRNRVAPEVDRWIDAKPGSTGGLGLGSDFGLNWGSGVGQG